MQRQSVRTVAFLGCVTILTAFWWLAGRDLGLHAVDSAERFVWPWLELLGVAAVWHVLSGRLDLGSGPRRVGLSVTVRVAAVVGGLLAATVHVNAEYDWWFDVRGHDTGGGDIQVTWDSVLKAGAIRFVLVYFTIAAITFGLAAAMRARRYETEASTRPWRDALLYLAVVFFCGQLAVVYAIHDADNPLTAPPHWLSLVFMVLALGLALLGGIGRPQAVAALGIDIAVIAVPALALTSFEEDTFGPRRLRLDRVGGCGDRNRALPGTTGPDKGRGAAGWSSDRLVWVNGRLSLIRLFLIEQSAEHLVCRVRAIARRLV